MVALVNQLKAQYPPPRQIIAYYGTIARTVYIAKVLGAVYFH
jgi:hypothetical protein